MTLGMYGFGDTERAELRLSAGQAGAGMRCLRQVRRLVGVRRLGVRSGMLAAGVLAALGGSVSGGTKTLASGVKLSPPFDFGYRTETSSLMAPCREVPNPPQDESPSDPSVGRIRIGTAVEGEGCTSLAHDVAEVWDLGHAPDALIGLPAHLTVVVQPGTIDVDGEGDATVGGSVSVAVGGSAEWTLRSFECSAGRCRHESPEAQEGRIVLEGTVDAVPAQIEGYLRAEAFVKDGTGKASIGLTGHIVSVSVRGADEPT